MNGANTVTSLDGLVGEIGPGCRLGVPADYSGVAMAATRALIRRGVRDLKLFCLPSSTLQADLLIGAGCVAEIEAAAVTLGEFGLAPRFTQAFLDGLVTMKDSTCPALHAALQATEKGVPFMALRGLIGSDLLRHRDDWKVVDNPFGKDDPIVLLPAVAPDAALFHAPMADAEGNVWIGRRRELATLAHAARRTLVTVEELRPGSFLDDERLAAGTLSGLYVSAVARVRRGAWPLGLEGRYQLDGPHLAEYARLAATGDGFRHYLRQQVFEDAAA